MVYETKIPRQHSASTVTEDCSDDSEVTFGASSGGRCCNLQLPSVADCDLLWSRFSRS